VDRLLRDAQRGTLPIPRRRQRLEQFIELERAGLAPSQDRLDDVWCDQGHPFGTIKSWMGATHFQMKTLKNVGTEMALHVLAYNMKRVISILGVAGLMEAIRA
jgi:hypothetical protein